MTVERTLVAEEQAAAEQAAAEQALAAAYHTMRDGLLASIRRQVDDPQLAEDLLHDVFGKAVRAVREGRAVGNLVGWLHQVVRTTIIDHYRARRQDVSLSDVEPAASELPDAAAFQALATCLTPLASTLPPIYRDALHAVDFHGQRLASLASAEGVTVSAIKSRVSRARGMLRQRVLACCVVSLDSTGYVDDFQVRASSDCECGPTAAGSTPPPSRARTKASP